MGGVEFDRPNKDDRFGSELDAVSSSILDAVYKIAEDTKLAPISLHFDELDQGLSTLDGSRTKMLIGLILAAREIRREAERLNLKINPVVYLRTDIWEDMQFSDKNKISQTLTLNLRWNSTSLLSLIEARLRAKLAPSATWADITTPMQ